ncbi:hypothetical protein FJT64_008388 [Amphibalanus amphitrite]|uniref:Peptidase A2 domain-containing protein n=1 Tax=Amphibalanus amphitrite TaxID=1232801 RepID=A0A6A4VLD1_AMPAM|nr:hypothetical protein FJT64_008388 [Amphibalanus amphitrite]
MAWLGVPPVFKRNEESFGAYARRLEQFFVVNDLLIPDDKKAAVSVDAKRRAVLLTALEPDTFSLLEDLLAPAGVAEVTCARIIEVLTSHFEPDESPAIVPSSASASGRPEGAAASASGSVSAAVEEEELYSLFRCSGDRRAPIKLNVMLDDRPVSMELDTGAALSVCGRFPDRTD